jgi:hypothetical protein
MEATVRKKYCIRAINERGRVIVSTMLNGVTKDAMEYFCLGLSFIDNMHSRYVVAYEVNEYGHAYKIAKSVGMCPRSYNHWEFMDSYYDATCATAKSDK